MTTNLTEPSPSRRHARMRRSLVAVLATSSALLTFGVGVTAADAAASYTTRSTTVQYSSDSGAKYRPGDIQWGQNSSESPVSFEGYLDDVAADGAGPIIFGYAYNGSTLVGTDYKHNTSGSSGPAYFFNLLPVYSGSTKVTKLVVKVCNGGSESAPKACGASKTYDNPLN